MTRPIDQLDEQEEADLAAASERQRLATVAGDTSLTRRSMAELAANQRASTREYLEGETDDAA